MSSDKKSTSKPTLENEEICIGLQTLKNEQRVMANKLSEMEAELNEHRVAIDVLKNVDGKRKCYRMIAGILCERTVEEVMPTLLLNKDQLTKVIETLNEQLTKKGSDINDYRQKYSREIYGREPEDLQRQEESKETKRNAVVINPTQV